MVADALVLTALAAALSGTTAVVATLFGLATMTVDTPLARRLLAQRMILFLALLAGVGGVFALGPGEELLAVLVPGGVPASPGGRVVGIVILGLAASLPGMVVGQLFPVIQQAHAGDVSWRDVAVAGAFNASGLAGMLALAAIAYVAILAVQHPAVLVAVPVVLGYLGAASLPYLVDRAQPTRPPSDAERAILEDALAVSGFPISRVRVIEEQDAGDLWRPFDKGVPPTTRLFLPAENVERYERDVLLTILIQLTSSSLLRVYRTLLYSAYFGGVLAIALSSDLAAVLAATDPSSGAVVGLIGYSLAILALPVLGPLLGKRLVYRGDQNLAERVGHEHLASVLERLDEERGGVEVNRVLRHVLMVPALASRTDRLRAAGDGAAGPPQTDSGRSGADPGQSLADAGDDRSSSSRRVE